MFHIFCMNIIDKGKDRYPDETSLHLGVHKNSQFVLDEYKCVWWTLLAFVNLNCGKT